MREDNLYWMLALQSISGVGSITAGRLLDKFKTPQKIFGADAGSLEEVLNKRALNGFKNYDPKRDTNLKREIEKIEESKARAITILDEDYPENLSEIVDAPIILYIMGEIIKTDELAVGIVGTRRPTRYGIDQSRRFSQYLVKQGVTIVSGMAMGIDGNAQDAAIRAGGRTIAVLGCGVDVVYPSINAKLYREIIQNGAVVSEYPLGTKADPKNFPPRNRIVSGLSKAVLIVEGRKRSGALITADYAATQGRDVYAIPGHIDRPNSAAPNSLIRDGAIPALEPKDVIASLKIEAMEENSRKQSQEKAISLTGISKKIYDAMDFEGVTVDNMAKKADLDIRTILGILTELEMKDIVKRLPGSKYARNV
ncbi:DNA-processing protein DprA [bacterium]|nr:DNA-processing protein DprA [bacterium]